MNNYSIAQFGSLLRPEYDKYSDKDLLVVGKSFSSVRAIKQKYESEGYSVSMYTYKKLHYLSENGSLFLDHLKKEALIISDFKNQLGNIINHHVSIRPSDNKISEAKAYFDILDKIINTSIGLAWFCDCFYVGLRNYLILMSARNGYYNFSFLQLLDEFVGSGTLSIEEKNILKELRVIKRNYREKRSDEFPDEVFVSRIIEIGTRLNLLTNTKFVEESELQVTIRRKLNSKGFNHYLKLRLAEMYYCSLNIANHEMEKKICNPQMYASMFKDQNFINTLIADLDQKNGTQQHLPKRRGFVYP